MPPLSCSAMARSVPSRTNASSTHLASAGQMCFSSQVISGRSSARPRNRLIAACPCALIRPGLSSMPGSSRTSLAASFKAAARGPINAMRPSRMPRACSLSTTPAGSTGTSQVGSSSTSSGAAVEVIAGFFLGSYKRRAKYTRASGLADRYNRRLLLMSTG